MLFRDRLMVGQRTLNPFILVRIQVPEPNCMNNNVFIFHGTEGYPEENWFPWLKQELEQNGYKVFVPQFPSPPIVPAKLTEWFGVFEKYDQHINENTIFIGHSLGDIFTLRILEKLKRPIKAAFFIGTPIGVRPIANYDRDNGFGGFTFNWESIKKRACHFVVFQSDNDPYVSLGNGQELAKNLGVELNFVPNAGHFNTKAGYLKFEKLRDEIIKIKKNAAKDEKVDVLDKDGNLIEQKNLDFLFTVIQSKINKNYINNEFNEVYLVKMDLDISMIVIQKEELTEIKFIHFAELEKLINSDNDEIFVSHDEEYKKLFELLRMRL